MTARKIDPNIATTTASNTAANITPDARHCDDTHRAARHRPTHVLRRVLVTLALAIAIASVAVVTTHDGERAEAWSWSSHVKVAGKVNCANRGVVGSPRVTIRLNNGESGTGTGNWLNNYGIQFLRIPSGGVAGTATITCPTWTGTRTYTRSVWVFRPAVGAQISRRTARCIERFEMEVQGAPCRDGLAGPAFTGQLRRRVGSGR